MLPGKIREDAKEGQKAGTGQRLGGEEHGTTQCI